MLLEIKTLLLIVLDLKFIAKKNQILKKQT